MEQYSEVLLYGGLDDPMLINIDYKLTIFKFNNKCSTSLIHTVIGDYLSRKSLDKYIKDKVIQQGGKTFAIPDEEENRDKINVANFAEYLNKEQGRKIVAAVTLYEGNNLGFIKLSNKCPFKNDLTSKDHSEIVETAKTRRAFSAINSKFTENDSKVAEYKAGLSLWMIYFKYCHQLEDSLDIKDEGFGSETDVGNRDIKFDINNYYIKTRLPEFHKEFFTRHPKYFKKYVRNIRLSKLLTVLKWLATLGGAIGVAMVFFMQKSGGLGQIFNVIGGIIVGGIVGFVVYLLATLLFGLIIAGPLKSSKMKFDDYFDKYIVTKPEYQEERKADEDTFKKDTNAQIADFMVRLSELRQVRAQIEKICPLRHYGYEKAVSYCLFLLDNGRASDYKEALNMFVDDEKTEKILESNAIIQSSLRELNDRVAEAISTVSSSYATATSRILDRINNMTFTIKR